MEVIGSLEEIILMILLKNEKINSVEIAKQYQDALFKTISIPAIHVVLKRMENKGWVESVFGEPTAERGGRRKRLYDATASGYRVVEAINEAKSVLWSQAIKPTLNYAIK